nr:hypothetical protein [Clostridioides sp.]
MTLNDFLKRIDIDKAKDKMIIFTEGKGWSNVWFKETDTCIEIFSDNNLIFSEDK